MEDTYTFKTIPYKSFYYRKAIELRDRILRKPLHLTFSESDLEKEKDEIGIGLFYKKELIAILQLKPVEDNTIKLRQMAVDTNHQQKGIGKKLVLFAEKHAQEKGFHRITLHARKTALIFYKKLGYQLIGSKFMEVNIPHYKMYKDQF